MSEGTSISRSRRIQIVGGLVLCLLVPFLHLGDLGRKYSGLGSLIGGEVLWWILVAIVLVYVVAIERRGLSTIGFRKPGILTLVLGVVAGIVMIAGALFCFAFLYPAMHATAPLKAAQAIMATPFWYRMLLVTRAAGAEEILFRGYSIERIDELTGNRLLGAIVSWVAFTLAHLSGWSWAHLIFAGFGGAVLTVLYLWRRNIWANMVAHWIADGAGFLLPHP